MVILLFVGTNIETDLTSSLSAVQELRQCFDSIELFDIGYSSSYCPLVVPFT